MLSFAKQKQEFDKIDWLLAIKMQDMKPRKFYLFKTSYSEKNFVQYRSDYGPRKGF